MWRAVMTVLFLGAAAAASAQTSVVTAAWDPNSDGLTTGYMVYYGSASGSYQWSYDAGNQTTAQLSLSRGATYYFTVRGYNASAQLGPAAAEATIALPAVTVTAPTASITATLQSSTSALVSWQTANAVSATINGVGVDASGSTTVAISGTTTFTILAIGSTGLTATSSATVTVTAPPPPPPSPVPNAPTGMATSVYNSRVRFSWRAPSGTAPSTYLIDVGISGTTRMLASGISLGNVLTVSADLPKGRYWTRVRAKNSAGVSGYSNLVSFKVGRSLVSPKGFTVTWIGSTAVLTWSAPASDGAVEDMPTAYVLEAGTAPGLADVATVNLGNVNQLSVPIPSGTYYVRLRAENTYGDSEPTPDLVLVPPGAPQAPTSFAVSRVNGTAHLRWNAPAGPAVTGYVIEVGSAPGLTDITRLDVGNITQFSAPAPAGTYYIRVRARNARGPGLASNEGVLR